MINVTAILMRLGKSHMINNIKLKNHETNYPQNINDDMRYNHRWDSMLKIHKYHSILF